MKLSIILLLCAMCSLTLAANKVYKWVDKEGNIHYSETKPDNQSATTIKMPKVAAPSEQASQDENKPTHTEKPSAKEDNAEAEAKAQAQQKLAAADRINHKKMCQQAKSNRDALNASVRVSQVDPDTGEQVRMTDDERVNALQKAEKAIKDYCQ